MKSIDSKLATAIVFTTILALAGYLFLSLIAKRYIADASSSGAIFEAPLLVIGTMQSYWWLVYGLLIGLLVFQWAIKR